ncbi:MAG: helix-turn-helix domain-containing protein [Janthinobacterium lividum]
MKIPERTTRPTTPAPSTPPVLPTFPGPGRPAPRAQAPRKPRRAMPAPTEVGQGEDPRAALGRIVHRHRIALGISQEDLADQVGLDRTYVSGIERGIRNPTFLVLLRLARVLEVPASRLVELEEEDKDENPAR